jgi:hypothetical protein
VLRMRMTCATAGRVGARKVPWHVVRRHRSGRGNARRHNESPAAAVAAIRIAPSEELASDELEPELPELVKYSKAGSSPFGARPSRAKQRNRN